MPAPQREKWGVAEYRCKRCGGVESSLHIPDVHLGVISIVVDLPLPWNGASAFSRESVHSCSDGGYGISELIGVLGDLKKKE